MAAAIQYKTTDTTKGRRTTTMYASTTANLGKDNELEGDEDEGEELAHLHGLPKDKRY